MTKQLYLPALLLLACMASLSSGQDAMTPLIMKEADSVTVNEARLRTVSQGVWKVSEAKEGPRRMLLQLQITNLKKKDVAFFPPWNLSIKDSKGKEVEVTGGWISLSLPRPLQLPAGVTYAFNYDLKLSWDKNRKKAVLLFDDGNGGDHSYHMIPGRYRLSVRYASELAPIGNIQAIGNVPVWQGDARTPEVTIEIMKE